MNSINTKAFEVATADLPPAGTQEVKTVLSKLMAAWEAKSAKTAKRAAGMSLVAVSLAACNGSSSNNNDSDDSDESTNPGDDGSDGGAVTPVNGGVFTVLDFPTDTSGSGLFLTTSGGLVPVDGILDALTEAVNGLGLNGTLTTDGGSTVTSGDIQVLVDTIQAADGGGDVIINAGSGGAAAGFVDILNAVIDAGLLDEIVQVEVVTTGRVILTPSYNSGQIIETSLPFGAGDQFEDGFFANGVPAGGDDTILFSRTELLHAAIVDGGGGADTIQIAAKGPYAQPTLLRSIETVEITHQFNSSLSALPDAVDPNDIDTAALNKTTFLLFTDPSALVGTGGTWIDLGAAFDLQTLTINESGNAGGQLAVVGVRNAATLELSDGFQSNVTVDYGIGGGAVFDLVLRDVNFQSGALLNVAQNSPTLRIESAGEAASSENFLENGNFGPNLRFLEVSGDTFLNIAGSIAFNTGDPITIDASPSTGGVDLTAFNASSGNTPNTGMITVMGSSGDDEFTLAASEMNITSGMGENTYQLTGNFEGTLITGMYLTFNGSGGANTIFLNADSSGFDTLLAGSSISGGANLLVIAGSYNVTEAALDGVGAVIIQQPFAVLMTADQVSDFGAAAFSIVEADEALATPDNAPNLLIKLEDGSSVTLSDLIDVTALEPAVKLGFVIPQDATLTLSAEELHKYLGVNAIDMGDDSFIIGESTGKLVITDAGQNFDPFNAGAVDADGLALIGGGTITGSDNNVTIERSPEGFERPSQDFLSDVFTIDSDAGDVVVEANDFGNDDEFTLPISTTLVMIGDNDITFEAPLSFDGNTDFTIDFSDLGGSLNGLEIVDFHDITHATDPAEWGAVIGNGGARIDVQLSGDVGTPTNGLVSSGVATYVVTDMDGSDREFWTSDPTEDLEVLGLQGNGGLIITFGNVRNGVNFLMEGDGFGSFDDVPKALEPLDESNIGTLKANFAPGSGTVTATVDINNQGVELGAASDGGEREFYVDGIDIDGAQTIIVNVTEGDADIGGVPVGGAGITGDVLENIVITSADDVTLTLDSGSSDLDSLDAGGVAGTMTLLILPGETVDLSDTTLTGIDAVTMGNLSTLTITSEQLDAIGAGNIALDDGDTASLVISVTDSAFDVSTIDPSLLPEGLSLSLQIEPEVELTMTAEQFAALAEAGVTFIDGATPPDEEPGSVNITNFNADSVAVDEDTGAALVDYSIVPATIAGTVTFDGPLDLVIPQVYAAGLGNFGFALEGGTIGLESAAMANGLVVDNGNVDFLFTSYGFIDGILGYVGEEAGDPPAPGVDASGYTNIVKVTVGENFRDVAGVDEFNVESIAFLDEATEVDVAPLNVNILSGVNQVAFVGGVPIDNPDGDPAPVVEPSLTLVFDNITGDPEQNVQTVDLFFEVGGNEINNVVIGSGADPVNPGDVKPLFQSLAITSNGDAPNSVNDIFANAGNDLLDVLIVANQAFEAQSVFVSSEADEATATVTISGTADVTLKAINSSDPEVDTLVIDTAGYTGTLTVTGGSDSLELAGTETVTFTGDGTVTLDTAEELPGDDFDGIDGGGDLVTIDALEQTGDLTLGVIKNVADGFTLLGGTGVITGEVEGLPANYLIDLGTAADGSAIDLGDITLTAGTLELVTDPDTLETTLTFGDGAAVTVDAVFDLGDFDNVVFGTGVVMELGEAGVVQMDDELFAEYEAAGGTIVGETEKLFGDTEPAITLDDLSDARGLTQINLEEGTGPYTLTSEQVEIARPGTVDGDGVFTPTAENGDFAALKADPGLVIEVSEGDTFEVTDVDADGLDISGDGAVVVTIEGTKGAELTVTAGDDNNAGQSVVVNYTLGGEAGSVTVTNSSIDFTDASAVAAAIASALDAVDGLAGTDAGNVVTFGAEEAGVDFSLGAITVTDGGSGAAVAGESTTSSDADMSGNTVVDTTHVFPSIATGFYVLTGTLGGAPDPETDDLTVTLQTSGNFIDAEGVTIPAAMPEDTEIVLSGAPEVKFADAFLDGKAVTGDGSVQVENATTADFSTVELPVEVTLTGDATFTGSFNSAQPLTITDNDPDTEFELDIRGADGLPASITLDGTLVDLTADQGDGLTIDGGSTARVILDPDGNEDLSDISVDLVLQADGGGSVFGGVLPASDVEITGNVTLRETGTSIPAGTSFSVGVAGALTLTGAQADGRTITPLLDDEGAVISTGSVTITDPDGTEDLSGIDIPLAIEVTDEEATELTLSASEIAGKAIGVTGGDPAETFTVTVSGLEDALSGDFSGLEVVAGDGASDVVFDLDSSGDVEIGFNAVLDATTAGTTTLAITGDGTVSVADGATGDDSDPDLTGLDAIDVGEDATLEADADLVGDSNFVDRSIVSGDGTLVFVGIEAGEAVIGGGTDGVALQVFAIDDGDFGTDGPVSIISFVNGGGADPTDALDLNAILDVTGVTTGINVAGLGTGNENQVIILNADAAADPDVAANVVTAFDGATAGSTAIGAADAENFLVLFNDDGGTGDSAVWLWQDGVDADGGGTDVASDGIVGESELTLVADLSTDDNTPLTADNFVI